MFVAALSDFVKIVANQQWREAIWTKVVQLSRGKTRLAARAVQRLDTRHSHPSSSRNRSCEERCATPILSLRMTRGESGFFIFQWVFLVAVPCCSLYHTICTVALATLSCHDCMFMGSHSSRLPLHGF